MSIVQTPPIPSPIDEAVSREAKRRLDRCMFRMFQDFPFWAFLVEKCKVILLPATNDRIATAAIDKSGNIYFNETFLTSISDSMLSFVLAHEVMHLLLDHHSRKCSRHSLMWNVAGDALINTMLSNHFNHKGVSLDLSDYVSAGSVGLSEEELLMLTIEEVYDIMAKAPKPPPGKGGKKGGKGEGEGQGAGISSCSDLAEFNPGETPTGTQIRQNSEDTPTTGKEWSEAGLEAATRSKIAGNCPKFMERAIDGLLNPSIDWDQALAFYLRQKFCMKGRSRHTFTPPNRRYLYQDIILTSRVHRKKPSIAFSIDTSGSMSQEDISKGIAELNSIRKIYGIPVYFLEADYTVHKATWIQPNEEIPNVTGGGGTSFVPVMEHLAEHKPDIDVLLYFTDGYGDFGPPPNFEVLWVLTSSVEVPYGKFIKIPTTYT